MPEQLVIALSGYPGSLISQVRVLLADLLGAEELFPQEMLRIMAERKGMSVDELLENWLIQSEYRDGQIIKQQAELISASQGRLIVQGDMSPFIAPEVPKIKIFLNASREMSTKRTKKQKAYSRFSMKEVERLVRKRVKNKRKRFQELYGMDCFDKSNFDIVIDTTNLSADQVVDRILERMEKLRSISF